jgi:hypothetical protein
MLEICPVLSSIVRNRHRELIFLGTDFCSVESLGAPQGEGSRFRVPFSCLISEGSKSPARQNLKEGLNFSSSPQIYGCFVSAVGACFCFVAVRWNRGWSNRGSGSVSGYATNPELTRFRRTFESPYGFSALAGLLIAKCDRHRTFRTNLPRLAPPSLVQISALTI